MTYVRPTPAHTNPAQSVMVAGEIVEYVYDAVNDLGAEQLPTNPSVELLNAKTRQAVSGGATMDTTPIEETRLFVRLAGIERGGQYELRIGFDHTNPRVGGERTVKIHQIDGVG